MLVIFCFNALKRPQQYNLSPFLFRAQISANMRKFYAIQEIFFPRIPPSHNPQVADECKLLAILLQSLLVNSGKDFLFSIR